MVLELRNYNTTKCSPRLSKMKETMPWLHNRNYFPSFLNICKTTTLEKQREHNRSFSPCHIKNFAINPKAHHIRKPLKEFGYGVVHKTTLFTFLVFFLLPSFAHFFSLSLKSLKKSTPSKQCFFSFFFLFWVNYVILPHRQTSTRRFSHVWL